MDEKTVKFSIHFNSNEVTTENVSNWFKEMVYFKPVKMSGTNLTKYNARKFNAEKFFNGINGEVKYRDCNFSLKLEGKTWENSLRLSYRDFYSHIHFHFDYETYLHIRDRLLDIVDTFFQKHQGVVAYACSADDYVWQIMEDIDYHKRQGKFNGSLRIKQDSKFPDRQIIDIEYNPGHSHFAWHDLWFGSCWAMWFGDEYFKHIPKETLANFKDCYENKQLPDGSIRILLHEDMWDYDKPENRERQWAFRRHAGVDEVAHRLENTPVIVENPNPHVDLCNGNFEHGGVHLIKVYCDSKGRNMPQSQASECRIREIDAQGKVVWSETKKL